VGDRATRARSTRWLHGATALALVLVCAPRALADAAAVGVIAATPADEPVLPHLATLIDAPLVRREVARTDDLAALLAQGATWPERHLVVVDREHGVLHAIDTRDGTIVTRLLPDASVRESPYAVAFVTAELLGLSVQLTEGPQAATAPPATPAEPAPRPVAPGFAIGLGAELASQPASGATMLRPMLEGLLQLGSAPVWPFVGARIAALGSWSRGSGDRQVDVTRHHLGLMLGAGTSLGRLSVLGALGAGLELGSARLASDPGETDRTPLAWLGLGLQSRYPVFRPLSVFAGADLRWTPVATRYQVRGDEVVAPARTLLSLSLGLSWDELP
jgi:hypothetical protein